MPILGRAVQQRAVLGDDPIEQVNTVKIVLQVGQLAAGDQDELAAGGAQLLERGDGARRDDTVAGEGAVVVAGQDDVAHTAEPSAIRVPRGSLDCRP